MKFKLYKQSNIDAHNQLRIDFTRNSKNKCRFIYTKRVLYNIKLVCLLYSEKNRKFYHLENKKK
jgi:hypothetical protein